MERSEIIERISEANHLKSKIIQDEQILQKIIDVSKVIENAFREGRSVYFCGNGGSAADAQHLASELSGRYYLERPALPAEALHVNSSFITAVSNDYGYQHVFARAVQAFGRRGDVLVALTTSGNSENLIAAVEMALSKGMITISLTGTGGGKLKNKTNINVDIPSSNVPRIQEVHMLIGHIICEFVENSLFNG